MTSSMARLSARPDDVRPSKQPRSGQPGTRDVFRLDRRREAREAVDARRAPAPIPAAYSDHDGRMGITHVTVIDRSELGLGVRAATRIEPGMSVTIGGSAGEWLRATAVRCTPDTGGFRVGLRLHAPRTAA
jgi:hypothetical protein